MANVEEIISQIETLSVLDLVQLTKTLQEKWGVSAAAAVAVGAPAAAAAAAPAAAEEEAPTEFNVILTGLSATDKKIGVIKVVRELTSLGLKEAKDLVEAAPKPIKEGVTKEEGATLKAKLEEAGCTVEIKAV